MCPAAFCREQRARGRTRRAAGTPPSAPRRPPPADAAGPERRPPAGRSQRTGGRRRTGHRAGGRSRPAPSRPPPPLRRRCRGAGAPVRRARAGAAAGPAARPPPAPLPPGASRPAPTHGAPRPRSAPGRLPPAAAAQRYLQRRLRRLSCFGAGGVRRWGGGGERYLLFLVVQGERLRQAKFYRIHVRPATILRAPPRWKQSFRGRAPRTWHGRAPGAAAAAAAAGGDQKLARAPNQGLKAPREAHEYAAGLYICIPPARRDGRLVGPRPIRRQGLRGGPARGARGR